MAKPQVEHLMHGEDGAIFYGDPELGRFVWLRVTEINGRWSVTDMHWPDETPIRTEDLRRVPIGKIEAFVNQSVISDDLREHNSNPHRPLAEIAAEAEVKVAETSVLISKRSAISRARRLKVPTTRPFPDSFFAEVGHIYAALAPLVPNPATLISQESGTAIGTVHWWLKEARRRGLLAPGRQRNKE